MIYYNAGNNGFYVSEINEIPEKSVEITQEYHTELLQKQASGFIIQSDEAGFPIAVEYVMTADEIKTSNESKQQQLISKSNQQIAVLQDIVDFDMQKSNEDEQLNMWKKYRILLTRIDLSSSEIVWPEKPN